MKTYFVMLIGAAAGLLALPLQAQEVPTPVQSSDANAVPSALSPASNAGAEASLATVPVDPMPEQKAATAPETASRNRFIEEVVVTAQKREENLQDVPISISAFSGEQLEARGVGDPTALAQVTPGLTYNVLVGYSLIYIRGVGSDAFEPTADQSVATYLDGIYLPFGHGLAQNFAKLERIEVLKGPQGTLFGRNATGGAINIVTKKPSDTFEIDADGTLGSFDNREAKLFVTGPLLDGLSGSVSLLYSKVDSYYDLHENSPVQSLDPDETKGLNGRLLWEPSDEFSVSLNTLLTRFDGTGSIVNTAENPKLGFDLLINGYGPREASIDYPPFLGADSDLYYGQVTWKPEWLDIKLLASHQTVHTDLQYDFDSSPAPLVYFHASNQFTKVKTAELQFLSKQDGILPDWMQTTAGLYYFKSDAGYDPVIFGVGSGTNPLLLPPALSSLITNFIDGLPFALPIPTDAVNLTLYSTIRTEAIAAYLQSTFFINDQFDITLGGRVQKEKRQTTRADNTLTTTANTDPTLISFGLDSDKRTDFSPKVTLDFKPWDGQLLYATASRASKSGTFNMPAIYTKPRYVKPEIVTAYEIGNKGTLLDGTLRYSLAGFLNKIKDLQTQIVSLQSGGAQNLVNADAAEIKGVDLDFTWQPLPDALSGLVFTAAGSYIDGKYTAFPDGSGFNETTGLFFGPGSLTLSPGQEFAGNKAVRTPKWSFTLSPNYSANVPAGILEFGVDYSYNSGYFFDTQNTVKQPAYSVLNGRISYLHESSGLRLSVFGKNLTDEDYYINRFQTDFATNSIFAAPRTYGVTLSYSFKS